MANRMGAMALVIIMGVLLCRSQTSAQSTSGCTSKLIGLMPCLNYISGNSSTPSASCCSQLASVVQSQPQCLCVLLNGGASSIGITINKTRALALPDACNVKTPPASRCNSIAPTSPATPATPSTPSTSSTPSIPSVSGSGSKNVPSTTAESSDGSLNKMSSSFLLGFLLVASGASVLGGL